MKTPFEQIMRKTSATKLSATPINKSKTSVTPTLKRKRSGSSKKSDCRDDDVAKANANYKKFVVGKIGTAKYGRCFGRPLATVEAVRNKKAEKEKAVAALLVEYESLTEKQAWRKVMDPKNIHISTNREVKDELKPPHAAEKKKKPEDMPRSVKKKKKPEDGPGDLDQRINKSHADEMMLLAEPFAEDMSTSKHLMTMTMGALVAGIGQDGAGLGTRQEVNMRAIKVMYECIALSVRSIKYAEEIISFGNEEKVGVGITKGKKYFIDHLEEL